jgi:hypothetical protein
MMHLIKVINWVSNFKVVDLRLVFMKEVDWLQVYLKWVVSLMLQQQLIIIEGGMRN